MSGRMIVIWTLVAAAAVAGVAVNHTRSARRAAALASERLAARQKTLEPSATATPASEVVAAPTPAPTPEALVAESLAQPRIPAPAPALAPQEAAAQVVDAVAANEPIFPKPVSRAALSCVGYDPEAEEVWVAAINDPNVSKHDRSDLIEDLNEEGFPDPHHVTMEDLPLIVNRLALIEELAPDAMDEVNADAFQEAYKDLANMYIRLMGWQ